MPLATVGVKRVAQVTAVATQSRTEVADHRGEQTVVNTKRGCEDSHGENDVFLRWRFLSRGLPEQRDSCSSERLGYHLFS